MSAGTTLGLDGQDLTTSSVISSAGSVALNGCTEAGSYACTGDTNATNTTFTGPVALGISLEVNGTVSFAPTSGGPVTLTTGNLGFNYFSTLQGSDNFAVSGTLTTYTQCTILGSAGSSLTANDVVFGPGDWTLDGRAMTATGTVTWASGPGQNGETPGVVMADGATFTSQGTLINAPPLGVQHVFGLQTVCCGSGSGAFINEGSYILEGAGSGTEFRVPLTNSGTVEVQQGTLNLDVGAPFHSTDTSGPGTITGSFTGAAGTTMNLGYEDLAATTSVVGDTVSINGQVRCPFHANTTTASGTFTNPNVSVGNLAVEYGSVLDFSPTTGPQTLAIGNLGFNYFSTLQGSDNFAVSGTLTTYTQCTILGSAGSSLTANDVVFGPGDWTLDGRAMTATGTVTWASGPGQNGETPGVVMADGATFTSQGTFIDAPPWASSTCSGCRQYAVVPAPGRLSMRGATSSRERAPGRSSASLSPTAARSKSSRGH